MVFQYRVIINTSSLQSAERLAINKTAGGVCRTISAVRPDTQKRYAGNAAHRSCGSKRQLLISTAETSTRQMHNGFTARN